MTLSGWQPGVGASLGVLVSSEHIYQDLTIRDRLRSRALDVAFHVLAGHPLACLPAAPSNCLPRFPDIDGEEGGEQRPRFRLPPQPATSS